MRVIDARRDDARRWRLPRSVGLAVLLAGLLLAGGFAGGHSASSSSPLERIAVVLPNGHKAVTPEQVLAQGEGTYQLVDVRTREVFDIVHATDAVSVPEGDLPALAAELDRDRTLVLYCSCPDEKTSLRAAETLRDRFGVTNVVVLDGGLDAWEAAGGNVTQVGPDAGLDYQGCGCDANAEAFKLWAIDRAASDQTSD